MTRELPILFNTEMVQEILAGRKTQTRRIIKPVALEMTYEDGPPARKPPYMKGDILYVREAWKQAVTGTAGHGLIDTYLYRADGEEVPKGYEAEEKWRPSIFMPKRAARIWLRVKDVRAERLQDITEDDVCSEGAERIINRCQHMDYSVTPPEPCYNTVPCLCCIMDYSYPELFGRMVWNPTISKKDADRYDWYANPWVWRIEFERIEKTERTEVQSG